jgi:hypothetical protein
MNPVPRPADPVNAMVRALRRSLDLFAHHVDGTEEPELAAVGDELANALDRWERDLPAALLARACRE